MLKRFSVKNYKNFKNNIQIDFDNVGRYQFNKDCIENEVLSKVIIYGRNATGKTNLGNAMLDIRKVLLATHDLIDETNFLNADSKEKFATFSYTFQFDDDVIIYNYKKSSLSNLLDEELTINNQSIFKCDFLNKNFDFENLKYIHGETANIDRYMHPLNEGSSDNIMRLPFIRWLINNVAFSNDSSLMKLSLYVKNMLMIDTGNTMRYKMKGVYNRFYDYLEDQEKLDELESFLNIMGIECQLVLKKLPDGDNELYFKHDKLVPFYKNASSGTLVLIYLYNRLF
ncbi:MAG: ATP-binding protein, partial [Erysipelotrichaceae bacterium]|nr:ATP-binding protein [Erysipelotrichaceae bacterium]